MQRRVVEAELRPGREGVVVLELSVEAIIGALACIGGERLTEEMSFDCVVLCCLWKLGGRRNRGKRRESVLALKTVVLNLTKNLGMSVL